MRVLSGNSGGVRLTANTGRPIVLLRYLVLQHAMQHVICLKLVRLCTPVIAVRCVL
jgi:hypothetical protein